jgi:RHS repeat-associated protein
MSFQVGYDYTNNTNRITTSPFSYTSTNDPNGKDGNMTADNSHAYSWDTENKLTGIDSGLSNGICQTYDALGRVVEQDKGSACATSPTSSMEIVYDPSGTKLALMNGSTLVKAAFVSLPGGAQAVYNSSGLQYYRHPDWLGSSRLASTTSRTLYYSGAYAPFGENYVPLGTQDLSFTGQNQDTESSGAGGVGGLYDFLYREHSPVQGRWLSPDPSGLAAVNASDPQSWNRYAYVGNRPLNSTDPLGLFSPDCTYDFGQGCWNGLWPSDDDDSGFGGFPWDEAQILELVHPGFGPGGEPSGSTPGASPLDVGDLLNFMPGLDCGGGGSTGFGFVAVPPSGPSTNPCPIVLDILPNVLAQSPGGTQDKPKPKKECTDTDRDYNTLCQTHGMNFVQGWSCTGDKDCCRDKEVIFDKKCIARNTWVKGEYVTEPSPTLYQEQDACCRKR